MKQRVELLIIDPQSDFCNPSGSLFVQGADDDMNRLAEFIHTQGKNLFDIHVTMDSHHFVDIAHPVFWVDGQGRHPDPFTLISDDDVKNGIWKTTNPQFQARAKDYVKALKVNNRYLLCIWPPHCLIGSNGYSIFSSIFDRLLEWEKGFAIVDYVTKGSNFWTEHYSAVQADVPDPQDPGTMLNTRLIQTLEEADVILIAGEALSHCVANTVKDIADNFGEESIKKLVFLEDASSNVAGFEQLGADFVTKMTGRGMQVSNTKDFTI